MSPAISAPKVTLAPEVPVLTMFGAENDPPIERPPPSSAWTSLPVPRTTEAAHPARQTLQPFFPLRPPARLMNRLSAMSKMPAFACCGRS